MSNEEILNSAKLRLIDPQTGQEGDIFQGNYSI